MCPTPTPTEAMYMKIRLVGDVLDVITCAKFQNEIFMGYDFTRGRDCAVCECDLNNITSFDVI